LIECATAVVQEAAGGQRIVQVSGETLNILALSDSWLDLPQIPVTAVTSVTFDGTALTPGILSTNYKLRGDRLWRTDGWQTYVGQPSDVVVVYTHGYAPGAQELQMARSAVLSLAKGQFVNPSAVQSESIDDYNVSYNAMSAQMETAPFLKAALAKKYGRRAGLVRIG
ncbi:MAG: hypothetical protein V4515_12800, partial [Chloroflexota bacterium]